jgi:hypothetical protein
MLCGDCGQTSMVLGEDGWSQIVRRAERIRALQGVCMTVVAVAIYVATMILSRRHDLISYSSDGLVLSGFKLQLCGYEVGSRGAEKPGRESFPMGTFLIQFFLGGCSHGPQSRPFTLDDQTYKVCLHLPLG